MKIELTHVQLMSGDKRTLLGPMELTLGVGLTGLIGPNGSGKSMLLKLLSQGLMLSAGRIVFYKNGVRLSKLETRQSLGYVPQHLAVYEDMKVNNYLAYIAGMKGVTEIDQAISTVSRRFGLDALLFQKIGSCSIGEQRLAMIAQAFLNSPDFVFLDEPFVGLDLAQRRSLLETLFEYATRAVVVLSSHIVEEMDERYEQIIRMSEGGNSAVLYGN